MRIFNSITEAIKKYGLGTVTIGIGIDSYRRQIISEQTETEAYKIRTEEIKKNDEFFDAFGELNELLTLKNKLNKETEEITMTTEEIENRLKYYKEFFKSQKEYDKSINEYNVNKSPSNEQKMNEAKNRLDKCSSELEKNINIIKSDISDYLISAYNKYSEFLDSLTPDKIVCVINIIIGSITLSSFFTVLSIMLSENIINRISFLEKYPRILKLLKLRNTINKKVCKFHLFMHFIFIIGGILVNIYMFFI